MLLQDIRVASGLQLRFIIFYSTASIEFDIDIVVMPFLSHSIPWLSLSRLFEYRGPKSGPGPQEPHLHTEEKLAHRKQLEHFATTFQEIVREHSIIERGRYSTAQAYRDRATTWTASSLEESTAQGHEAHSSNDRHERREQEGSIETPSVSVNARTSTPSIETRRVFPAYFSNTYMSFVPPTSGGAYGREGLLESLADVSTWIDYYVRYKRYWGRDDQSFNDEEYKALWLDVKSCSDILRLLVIDAATTSDEFQRKERISTLLLLANHPEVGLEGSLQDGMSCCNLSSGFSTLLEKAAMVFIFLNLLLASEEADKDRKLLRPCHNLAQYNSYRGSYLLIPLLPRPAYMNMRSYLWMRDEVLHEHGHAIEHVYFNPLFAPRPSGRRSRHLIFEGEPASRSKEEKLERDVMADRQNLHEALKQMWKILIFCDMAFREAGRHINWEKVTLDAIRELSLGSVDKLVGKAWDCYEADRQEEEGSYAFYADTGKN